jgi:hypothetical protein
LGSITIKEEKKKKLLNFFKDQLAKNWMILNQELEILLSLEKINILPIGVIIEFEMKNYGLFASPNLLSD